MFVYPSCAFALFCVTFHMFLIMPTHSIRFEKLDSVNRFIVLKWLRVLEAVIVACMSAVLGFVLMYSINDCVPKSSKQEDESDHASSHNVQVIPPNLYLLLT